MAAKRLMVWACASVLCTLAHGQTFTGFPRQSGPLTGNEMVPADTGTVPPSVVFSMRQVGQFVGKFGEGENWLVAGDAGQNLWQRGTVGPVAATGVVFGPDRWAYWGGAVTVGIGTGVLPGFKMAYRMQRTAGDTGVTQVCMTQEIGSGNAVAMQGKVVEFDFGLGVGPNFSGTGVRISLVTGTGTDEGVGKLAFGINGGGGGTAGWTGQVSVVDAFFSLGIAGVQHLAVVGQLGNDETEAAVAVCWTPSGTAGAGDYFDLSGLQVRIAPGLATFVNNFLVYGASDLPTPSFVWRMSEQEAMLQYAYYWRANEGAGLSAVGLCRSVASTGADCLTVFPVPMVRVPTMGYVTGFAVDANAGGLEACTGLGTTAGMVATRGTVTVRCATAGNVKVADFLYENGGGGMIEANAEWM